MKNMLAEKPRWLLIVNGKVAGNAQLREAVRALREEGVELAVRVTWEGGDAGRFVGEALALGVHTVVVAGGDGSLNEVASALAEQALNGTAIPSLALLPLGTANDFARAADLPLDVAQALRLPLSTPAVAMDVLQVTANNARHWCVNLATGGFGTQVTVETDPELKRRLGGLAYVLTGLGRLGQVEPLRAAFRAEGFALETDFVVLGIGNGRQAGGGQVLCPDARSNDGLMDVTIVPLGGERGEFFSLLATAFSESQAAALKQFAEVTRQSWLEIESASPLVLNLDGEPLAAEKFRIDCVPGHLQVHLPAASPLLQPAAG